jgi:GT2 family glycosyltransferase
MQLPTSLQVTFLISSFNRRDVLLRTLGELSVISERCGVFTETIVVDNASTDGSADAVARDHPNVRLLRQTKNRGACAKNVGLAVATSQYVLFLDDDSYPSADSIKRMIWHFDADPMLGAAVFDVVLPDGAHECSAYPAVFIGCGTGFRRDALTQVGGLPEDFFMQAEEYDLSLRLLDGGWDVRRFEDLRITHLKTRSARIPTRTTRLDVRNNLTLIARYFPRKWMVPFAIDWMRRYRWLAQPKGLRHRLAFWRGLAGGLLRCAMTNRRAVSRQTFERFAMIDQIRNGLEIAQREYSLRSIILLDVGKNILPFWLAARACGVRIVAIADSRIARPGRRYRGIPIVDDATIPAMVFDAAIVANVSPVHAALRRQAMSKILRVPVLNLLEHRKALSRVA